MMNEVEAAMKARDRVCAGARPEVRRHLPTTIGFAAVPDHVRLPARFFGRFTACAAAQLS
ncbi:hypothetical protein G3545_25400 [Starkeya sp. ORNL1]|jgi:hypothetical protein|uniref:hypothetical protein n=1 Tax=Starkeya sp. ORNL1 TaxID=2709380 RepID=UPI001463D708|nr:hypothetical protein [Starkeya sp. ORNL1]QJP16678.1 hypothetical protein G3545_25400 [Starkeya sp. ORNL1]